MKKNITASYLLYVLLVSILFLAFFLQCFFSMIQKSPTYDEIVHAPAGLTEIITGTHRLVNDHPPLFRYLLAAPLFLFHPEIPFHMEGWNKNGPFGIRFLFGKEFFFGCGNNADQLLLVSRLVVVFFSLLLAWLVLSFAALLFGKWPGLFALFLFVFDPNILAHSRIAKNDSFMTIFIFMTFYQLYLYMQKKNLRNLILLGLCLGLAISTKYSAFVLLPIILLIMGYDHIVKTGKYLLSVFKATGQLIFILIISILILTSSYILFSFNTKSFKKTFYNQNNSLREYTVIQQINNIWHDMGLGNKHLKQGHKAYFMGKYSEKGFIRYFPVAFLIKNPIPIILFLFLSIIVFLFYQKDKKYIHIFLFSIISIYFLIIMFFSLNIGYRYLLPIQPVIAVYCAIIVVWLQKRGTRTLWMLFTLLCFWYAAGTLRIYPHYLAYFNEFIGGPENGSKYLVDSNLDWGQDLKGLKKYMEQNSIDWIYLYYFGNDDPVYRNIDFSPDMESLKLKPGDKTTINRASSIAIDAFTQGKVGYYAISATVLRGVYLEEKHKKFFQFLWERKPLAKIGYSIFIYKVE